MVKRHNHFKIRTNDPELLHYRSGKSKSVFVNVKNPCLQPLYINVYKNHSHTTRFSIINNTENASPSRLAVLEAG